MCDVRAVRSIRSRALACAMLWCLSSAWSSGQQELSSAVGSPDQNYVPFEVVSIRPSFEGEQFAEELLPDGFEVRGGSTWRLISLLYDPSVDQLSAHRLRDAPDWVRNVFFDVRAKVAPEHVATWRLRTAIGFQSSTFRQALQQLMVDRYELRAHTVLAEMAGFSLVMEASKLHPNPVKTDRTAQLTISKDPTQTGTTTIQSGGVIQFHNQPLSALAFFVASLASTVVEDRTGLKQATTSPSGIDYQLFRRHKREKIFSHPINAGI